MKSAYTTPKFVLDYKIGNTLFTGYIVTHVTGITFHFATLEQAQDFLKGDI